MDPALQELVDTGNPTDEVAVVVRLRDDAHVPAGLRIVAQFGPIATARVQRLAVRRVWEDPAVISLKAPRWYATEYGPVLDAADAEDVEATDTDRRRPPDLAQTGRGTVIGVIDWGCDFAHPDFVTEDGKSRLIALWDQRAAENDGNRYGYGRIHRGEALTAALAAADPYATVGYHPGISDTGIGAHGTHVMSIAAGNGRGGGPTGIAPEASLAFVHLGTPGWEKAGPLGDSANLLEAIHFIVALAGKRPLVFNLSMGRHGGSHDGTQLVERALDWLVRARRATAVVQSGGNYFSRPVHSCGRLRSGEEIELPFKVNPGDDTPNELEIWYPGSDVFGLQLVAPNGRDVTDVALGGQEAVLADGRRTGTLYHRARDPNNGDNHINLFQYQNAPAGVWKVVLRGIDVVDGRYHAWLERDPGCKTCQAQFLPDHSVKETTTGSICNGLLTIAVGAYDGHDPGRALAPFSSSGPTRDGRIKPVVLAPGVKILAARSHPKTGSAPPLTRMSGTSMAAPHVAGTIALMFETARALDIVRLRQVLFDALTPADVDDPLDRDRVGYGFLDTALAVKLAREQAVDARPQAYAAGKKPARESDEGELAAVEAAQTAPEMISPAEAPTETAAGDEGELAAVEAAQTAPEMISPAEAPTETAAGDEGELAPVEAVQTAPEISPAEALTETAAAADIEQAPIVAAKVAAVPQLEQESVMSAMCCGDKCKDCEHCRNYPCETCQCCQPQRAGESAFEAPEPTGHDPSWRSTAERRKGQGKSDEPGGEPDYPHPVDAAEAIINSGIGDATQFMAQSLSNAGLAWREGGTARTVFDDLVGRTTPGRRRELERHFDVVARPGHLLIAPLQAGDIVIRRGDGGFAHAAMIAHPVLYREHDAVAHGLLLEGPWPGLYAHVVEAGARPRRSSARFARRLSSADRYVLPDTLVLRGRRPDEAVGDEASEAQQPNPNIRWLQAALNRIIGAGLTVDGLDGPSTRGAVRRFQAARGLPQDAIAGTQTMQALRQALAAAGPAAAGPVAGATAAGTPPVPPAQSGLTCRTLDRFGRDSAALTSAHRTATQELARRIVGGSVSGVDVTGHASPEGPDHYNLALGQRRADNVAEALRNEIDRVTPGTSGAIRFNVTSVGEARAVSANAPSNRRVEVCFQALRIRHNIETPQGAAMLLKYAEAVRRMMAAADQLPTSWLFQRNIHGTASGNSRTAIDAAVNAVYTAPSPERDLAARIWGTCTPHMPGQDELLFLPWHRMYVFFFERICRKVLEDDSFTLPYWNYSNPSSRVLPAAFRTPANQSNPLFRANRNTTPSDINAGQPIDQGRQAIFLSPDDALSRANYGPIGVDRGFNNILNRRPHGFVHVCIGDDTGMGNVPGAANDPIFWLHHSNIDRLWASWNNAGRQNPTDVSWLDVPLDFADENGQRVTQLVRDFSSTIARGYKYDVCEPMPAIAGPSPAPSPVPAPGPTAVPGQSPGGPTEAVSPTRGRIAMSLRHRAAPAGGIALGSEPVRVQLAPARREGAAFTAAIGAQGVDRRLYLVVKNYSAARQPGIFYDLFLDLPSNASPRETQLHYAGSISFFDAVPHHGDDGAFAGIDDSFDITDLARRLRAAGRLSDSPTVTIAPSARPVPDARAVIRELALVEQPGGRSIDIPARPTNLT